MPATRIEGFVLSLQLKLLVLALAAWTRLLSASSLRDEDAASARARSLRYLPLAGAAVALPAAVAYAIAGLWLPHAVSLLCALGVLLLLTGAIHERGFAAWCDDLVARGRTERTLTAAGVAGLMLIMLGRFESLSSIDPSWIAVTLVTAAMFSRACAVLALGGAFDDGAPDASRTGAPDGAIALALGLAPVIAAAVWTGSIDVFGTAAGLSLAAAVIVRRTIGRRTLPRDTRALGAIQQLAELAFQLGILATLSITDETTADPAS